MNKLQKDFLRQSIADLKNLSANLETEKFSESVLRAAFRTLHTIKGTAQVFGFADIGNLTHEIENLLQGEREKRLSSDENFHSLLRESLSCLAELARKKYSGAKANFPKTLIEKLRSATKNDSPTTDFSFYLPPEIQFQLSKSEKSLLNAAFENEKNLFLIEAGFEFVNFESEFKDFRSILSENGEIAAVFSRLNFSEGIGFRFFLITEKSFAEISRIIKPFNTQINFKVEKGIVFSSNSEKILLQAGASAKKFSEQLGKQIEFDVLLPEVGISSKQLKILFDILLHLTRNAVDHAIEKKGKITIRLCSDENGLVLTLADNGRGVDLEKTRAKAIEKNLISANAKLNENEILRLIFAPGISTREEISEISGRGFGLDAVKDLVEKADGKINVSSKSGKGTSFEIFLPREK